MHPHTTATTKRCPVDRLTAEQLPRMHGWRVHSNAIFTVVPLSSNKSIRGVIRTVDRLARGAGGAISCCT